MTTDQRERIARAVYGALYPGFESLFVRHLARGGGDTGESDAMLKKSLQVADAVLGVLPALPDVTRDLLAALKGVVAIADRKTDEFDRAHAAIAKAEGRSLIAEQRTPPPS